MRPRFAHHDRRPDAHAAASAAAAFTPRGPAFASAPDGSAEDLDAFDPLALDEDVLAGARRRWRAPREDVVAALRMAARTTEQKMPEYAARGTALFVRTSSREQADRSTRGSPTAQLEAGYEDAERLGVRDRVILIDAFGEAGTRKANRTQFRRLRALVRAGAVKVVIVPEHHRLGRNVADAEAFFNECVDMGVLLLVNGQPFDPRVAADKYMLGMMAQFAQYENDARIRWLLRGKLQRAKLLHARFPLPSGLVWASPDDAAYVKAATEAGLGHYLAGVRRHLAKSPGPHGTLHVLPFPQQDVEAAARLRVQWLLEPGGSLRRVIERIQTEGSGWPRGRRGLVPRRLSTSTYRAGMRYSKADWETATLSRLGDYLASPSLYGIYSFYMESLTDSRTAHPARPRGSHGVFYPAARARTFAPLPDTAALLTASAVPAPEAR